MTSPNQRSEADQEPADAHVSRLQLLWDVTLFQFKLLFDGLRDLLLSPLSIISAVIGLVAGGEEPDRYFKQLLRLWADARKSGSICSPIVAIPERLMSLSVG
jgi:hypothetical protein